MTAHHDTAVIEACTAFTELDAEIIAYEYAYFDELDAALNSSVPKVAQEDLPDDPPPHPRDGELEGMLDRLCATRAATLAGIAARLQSLLHWEPKLIERWQGGGYSARMLAALLRDLKDMLRVETQDNQRAARSRGEQLARSARRQIETEVATEEAEAEQSRPGFW